VAIIQNVNVSSPNDGLGDLLRVSQVKANDNFSELNSKKVDIVAGFDLSENNFTDTEKAKLLGIEINAQVNVRGNMQQQDPSAPDYILGKPTSGNIVTYGTHALVGQNLTIFAGWIWKINDVLYTNSTDIVINFPYTASGLQRFDAVVFDTFNHAQRVDGDEVVSSPIVPLLIPDSILFSISLITDGTIGVPSITSPIDFPKIQFTADGTQTTFDLTTSVLAKAVFWNGALLDDADFSQTANILTLTFTPALGDKIKPI
jgi:hypothetical protein